MAVAESSPYALKVIGAPTLSNIGHVGLTTTGADIYVTTSQAGGTLYWIADEAPGVPSTSQIENGDSSNGESATASGSAPVTLAGIQGPFRVEPFNTGRVVNYFFFHAATMTNISSVIGASFRTLDAEGEGPNVAQPDHLVSFYQQSSGVVQDDTDDTQAEAQRAKSQSKVLGG